MGNLVDRARWFASYYHRNQKYSSSETPYTKHLEAVEGVLIEFGWGVDPVMLAMAWLHDVVEDCQPEVTVGYVRVEFGDDIADLVHRLTDEPGKNRAERHAKTYPKLVGNERATAVKLADRIANVRQSRGSGAHDRNHSLYEMYRKEHYDFVCAVYETRPSTEAMWKELDRLLGVEFFARGKR